MGLSAVDQAVAYLLKCQYERAVEKEMVAHGVTAATFERRYGKRLSEITPAEALQLMEGST